MTVKEKLQQEIDKTRPIPTIDENEMLADDGEFAAMLHEKRKLDMAKAYIEKRMKEIGPEIEIKLMAADATALAWDGCVVKIGNGKTGSKISATRLAELGVDLDTIVAATEEGRPYTFSQIVRPKGGKQITTWDELEAALPHEAFEG